MDQNLLYNQKFAEILNNPQTTVFLAGAGISIDAPSNLPLAVEIIDMIIEGISCDEKTKQILFNAKRPYREELHLRNNYLRMEELVELIYESRLPRAIVKLVEADCPNLIHFALAAYAKAGAIIMTTNFDCLIEKALELLGAQYVAVITNEDYEQFIKRYRVGDGVCYILKLHGCASNPASIQSTLNTIGKEMGVWDEANPKGATFHKMLLEKNLIVLGYSGSDDFDIVPALFLSRSTKPVFWMEHHFDKEKHNPTITSIYEIDKGHSFYNNKSHEIGLKMFRGASQGNSQFFFVSVCTKSFFEKLLAQTFPIAGSISGIRDECKQILLEDISRQCPDNAARFYFSALLLKKLSEHEQKLYCIEAGIEECIAISDETFLGQFYFLLGNHYKDKGSISEAISAYNKAMDIAFKQKHEVLYSQLLVCLAWIDHNYGLIDEAINKIHTAIEIDTRLQLDSFLASDYTALSVFLKEKNDMVGCTQAYKNAEKYYLKIGNIHGLLIASNNYIIGLNGFENGIDLLNSLEKIEGIAVAYGEMTTLANIFGNKGMILSAMQSVQEAIPHIEAAIKISNVYAYKEGQTRWLSELGYLYLQMRKDTEAKLYLDEAMRIMNEESAFAEMGTIHGRLGLLYCDADPFTQKEFDMAKYHFEHALNYDVAAKWEKGIVDDLGNLGLMLQKAGAYDEALKYFSAALTKAEGIQYHAATARQLGNIGVELTRKGDLEAGLQFDLKALEINDKVGNLVGKAHTLRNIAGDYYYLNNKEKAIEYLTYAIALSNQIGLTHLANKSQRLLDSILIV